uniref:Uncharacterized protein n=1 Tax=Schistocephalus solidus TaxID=70667 RepID=A0A0X3PYF2_SCHSO
MFAQLFSLFFLSQFVCGNVTDLASLTTAEKLEELSTSENRVMVSTNVQTETPSDKASSTTTEKMTELSNKEYKGKKSPHCQKKKSSHEEKLLKLSNTEDKGRKSPRCQKKKQSYKV